MQFYHLQPHDLGNDHLLSVNFLIYKVGIIHTYQGYCKKENFTTSYVISLASHTTQQREAMVNRHSVTLSLPRFFKPVATENQRPLKPLSYPTLHAQFMKHHPERPFFVSSNAICRLVFSTRLSKSGPPGRTRLECH